jgi:hypothetical protein
MNGGLNPQAPALQTGIRCVINRDSLLAAKRRLRGGGFSLLFSSALLTLLPLYYIELTIFQYISDRIE